MKKIINYSIYIIVLIFVSFQVFSQERVRLSSSTSSGNNSENGKHKKPILELKIDKCQTIWILNDICPKLEVKKAEISINGQKFNCSILRENKLGEQGIEICYDKNINTCKDITLTLDYGLKIFNTSIITYPPYIINSFGNINKGAISFSGNDKFSYKGVPYRIKTMEHHKVITSKVFLDIPKVLQVCDENVTNSTKVFTLKTSLDKTCENSAENVNRQQNKNNR